MDEQTIGVVGLGNMGGRIAARIQASGLGVLGYDIDPGRAPTHAITATGSLRELIERVDVGLLSLPDSTAVEGVIRGHDGVLATCRSGQIVVDLSTSNPRSTAVLAAALAERAVAMLDAGISGGAEAAEKGTLTIMVGGDAEPLERVRGVL